MADTELNLVRPDERLTVTFRGQSRELFFSFARQNSCLRAVNDPDRLATIMLDPDASEAIIRIMLAEKGGSGEQFEVELGETDISMEDYDKILTWVLDHLTYFFMKRFQGLGNQAKALGPEADRLVSSLTGSANSTSSEASAGPSPSSPPS